MKIGSFYVWPECFTLDRDGRPTTWLQIFAYCENGGLWPPPIVGVNVSKMPQGEGVSTEYIHRKFAEAKRN